MENKSINIDKAIAALAGLLISKHIITEEEWSKALDLIDSIKESQN